MQDLYVTRSTVFNGQIISHLSFFRCQFYSCIKTFSLDLRHMTSQQEHLSFGRNGRKASYNITYQHMSIIATSR